MTVDDGANTKPGSKLKKRNTEEKPIRVVIVEDHSIVREGLRLLIENPGDMAIVAEAETTEQALEVIKREKPDVVLLDLDLKGVNIVERIPEMLQSSAHTRILLLTGIRDAELHRRAIRLGALGLVLKDKASGTVLKAIRKVHTGEAWIDRSMTANLIVDVSTEDEKKAREASRIAALSHREREIIRVLCEGLSNKQIAERLFISETTVRNHITSILAKLELADRFELAIYSYRHGLATLPH